jgi:hypothetical protein
MTQRDNILQELKELQSSLATLGSQALYQVPVGYFDGLAGEVLKRIRASEAQTAAEELSYLSPLLNSISRQMPYTVPAGFFNGLSEGVVSTMNEENKSAAEELNELSPLLSGLKKQTPYAVPAGYFESLENKSVLKKTKPVAKVVSFSGQKWFRYAAAAAVLACVVTAGFVLFGNKGSIDPRTQPTEWVIKNTKKINPEAINNFVELTEGDSRDIAAVNDVRSQVKDRAEISELIKDIPDEEIQDFLDDTRSDENINDEDVLMN